jgi:hypothetical protein
VIKARNIPSPNMEIIQVVRENVISKVIVRGIVEIDPIRVVVLDRAVPNDVVVRGFEIDAAVTVVLHEVFIYEVVVRLPKVDARPWAVVLRDVIGEYVVHGAPEIDASVVVPNSTVVDEIVVRVI